MIDRVVLLIPAAFGLWLGAEAPPTNQGPSGSGQGQDAGDAPLGLQAPPVVSAEGLAALEGRWSLVITAFQGEVREVGQSSRGIVVEGDRLVYRVADEEQTEAKVTRLDPSSDPAQIDITRLRDNQTLLGIYAIDGGRLTICTSHRGARPKAFEATVEDGNLVSIYERVQPE